MRCPDGIESHEEMIDDHWNAVGGEEDHDDDLVSPGISQSGQEGVERWRGGVPDGSIVPVSGRDLWPEGRQGVLARRRGLHLQRRRG